MLYQTCGHVGPDQVIQEAQGRQSGRFSDLARMKGIPRKREIPLRPEKHQEEYPVPADQLKGLFLQILPWFFQTAQQQLLRLQGPFVQNGK